MGDYKDLVVWQKAHRNVLDVLRLVDGLPRKRSAWVIGDQLIRASSSVGANIAEGHGRQLVGHRERDFANFLQIALGSAQEADYWLMLMRDVGFVATPEIDAIIRRNEEVRKMLYAMAEHSTPDRRRRVSNV